MRWQGSDVDEEDVRELLSDTRLLKEDVRELLSDTRLLKKLKKGKISEEDFEKQLTAGQRPRDRAKGPSTGDEV